ncbi:MAG: rod shape-determining protein MreC [Planctomycetota bacterium]
MHRRHAWGASLIVLFLLPVLRPEGVPLLERPVAGFFSWWSKVPALNPELWGANVRDDEELSPRARALQEENALLREAYAAHLDRERDLGSLEDALVDAGLDRLPTARVARVLRTADPAAFRRSILIDLGREDGIERGVAVVSGPVFLGRVEVVHGRSALVKLVTDRRSRLEVSIRTEAGARYRGFVRGGGRGAVDGETDIRFVRSAPTAERIPLGSPVFTSNADRLVPAGLLVGFVTAVEDRDLDGVPTVRMRPALDLSRSATAIVLVPSPD